MASDNNRDTDPAAHMLAIALLAVFAVTGALIGWCARWALYG